MIAALFVATGGCYFGLEGVDPWDEQRDARLYRGPWPVVAHPPCSRWCRLAASSRRVGAISAVMMAAVSPLHCSRCVRAAACWSTRLTLTHGHTSCCPRRHGTAAGFAASVVAGLHTSSNRGTATAQRKPLGSTPSAPNCLRCSGARRSTPKAKRSCRGAATASSRARVARASVSVPPALRHPPSATCFSKWLAARNPKRGPRENPE